MDFFITAIVFIVIFSFIILIHEFGHFYTARKVGIKVEEFGIGLPPRIWGVKKKGILWSVNAIPFGGFVRLLGEDAHNTEVAKKKNSFAAQSARKRILVVCAGVMMNFLLAYLLLTVGFTVGMQPLIVSGEEVLQNIDDGNIKITDGVLVKKVAAGGAADIAGMMEGDRIISFDGRELISSGQVDLLNKAGDEKSVVVLVERDKGLKSLNLIAVGNEYGFEPYATLFLPRLIVKDVKEGSSAMQAGFLEGDVINKMNGGYVYFYDDYEDVLWNSSKVDFEVLRGGENVSLSVDFKDRHLAVVSSIFPNTAAEKAGLLKGDIIMSINERDVIVPKDVVETASAFAEENSVYKIERGGEIISKTLMPDKNGLIGIGLSTLRSFENDDLSVYAADHASSVLKIEDVRYPFWIAPVKALEESGRLSLLTVDMFGNVIKSIFTTFTVPDGVAGPVGIAQLTSVFIQEGLLSVLRFIALLSLSLAIINILPFPALDGGRLLFILVEVVTGRKVNARFEAIAHAIGFLLLMVLIFAVTYSDILKLFV